MKVFLSWSGDTSHQIALKLYSWLPMVIQRVEPYISSEIEKGTRWGTDIANELEQCSFGIACVTRQNLSAPWLLFEAGALSKSVSDGKLAPLLCGINQTDIQKSPLTQFQMTKFEKAEFLKLLKSINECEGENALEETVLIGIFSALWPDLDAEVSKILKDSELGGVPKEQPADASRVDQALEEILSNSRTLTQLLAAPERILPPDYIDHVLGRAARHGHPAELRRAYSRVRQVLSLLEVSVNGSDPDDKARLKRAYEMLMDARFMLRNMVQGSRPEGPRYYYRERPVERPDPLLGVTEQIAGEDGEDD